LRVDAAELLELALQAGGVRRLRAGESAKDLAVLPRLRRGAGLKRHDQRERGDGDEHDDEEERRGDDADTVGTPLDGVSRVRELPRRPAAAEALRRGVGWRRRF